MKSAMDGTGLRTHCLYKIKLLNSNNIEINPEYGAAFEGKHVSSKRAIDRPISNLSAYNIS